MKDPLVPPDMLERLALAASAKPTVVRVQRAAHNDLFLEGGDSLYKQLQNFVNALPAVSASIHQD